ncbi:hypothetical protein BYT27DRAFT_6334348 [Phlegmacium glaucopus]|nr:hypothetical protein BYT27DRAFT_6334348 [Phlegmacium glaucopus]
MPPRGAVWSDTEPNALISFLASQLPTDGTGFKPTVWNEASKHCVSHAQIEFDIFLTQLRVDFDWGSGCTSLKWRLIRQRTK